MPRPSAKDLTDLHAADAYQAHPYFEARRDLSALRRSDFNRRADTLERLLGRPLKGARVVEVGCDRGDFVDFLKSERGAIASGFDVAPLAVQEGRGAGRDVQLSTLEDAGIETASVDAVCAYDLIEHVADPAAFLGEAARVLGRGGALAVETPNFDGFVYRLGRVLARVRPAANAMSSLQERLWPPVHVQYFTGRSIVALLTRSGFEGARCSGRELHIEEVAGMNPLLKIAVGGAFAFGAMAGAPTILSVEARRR
ncbi:MAG: class I SAM-dependent methyltransferase [Parvularculaceae bacterium]